MPIRALGSERLFGAASLRVVARKNLNFPLSKQATDQMVRDAVDTAIKLYATAWDRCERGGEL